MANKPFLSRPKDRTLEAYKAWMNEILDHMLPDGKPLVMPEEKWEEGWKKFWSKADANDQQKAKPQGDSNGKES
jgi:hypothetical protein